MIHNLNPYPSYKDSGVAWVGGVPEHWEIERLKARVANINEITDGDQNSDLRIALEHVESWTGRLRRVDSEFTFDSKVKRFHANDVLFGKLRPYLAKVTRQERDGICVGEFFVLRPRGLGVHASYLELLLRSKPIIDAVDSSTFGAKMPRADWQFVGNMEIPFPPISEQFAIVRFLDYVDRRIRRYIRAKKKLVALLNEQKQAIIQHAVTRGLDPNVRLKPSGVEWLGEVPEHWITKRLKHVAVINGVTLGEKTDPDFCFRYIDISGVTTGRLVREPERMRFGDAPSRARRVLRKGDTIVSTVRTYLKAVWYVDEDVNDLVASTGFAVLSPGEEVEPRYLWYVIQSSNFVNRVTANSVGIAYPAIAEMVLGRFPIVVPPLPEQSAIVRFLDQETAKLDRAINCTQREIDLLREYRTRLITDVVTGKIDVREAAAHLPEEAGEPEPHDDTDDLTGDSNGETEAADPDTVPEEDEHDD